MCQKLALCLNTKVSEQEKILAQANATNSNIFFAEQQSKIYAINIYLDILRQLIVDTNNAATSKDGDDYLTALTELLSTLNDRVRNRPDYASLVHSHADFKKFSTFLDNALNPFMIHLQPLPFNFI